MSTDEATRLKNAIRNGYSNREDYPPFALTPFEDRNRYLEYVNRVIEDFTEYTP